MERELEALRDLVNAAWRIVVFTGAGISTESGIPDFRGPNGIWTRVDPRGHTIQNFLGSEEGRRRYWRLSTEMYGQMLAARPNAGHRAVAYLEQAGRLGAVITQNVDGLHQIAGNTPRRVIELHGTAREIGCLQCGSRVPREAFQPRVDEQGNAPHCERCGGLMKPATISFGQSLIPAVIERATEETERCDLFLVIGSSLQVYPAAGFPLLAVRRGVPLAIINQEETPHDPLAAVVLRGQAGEMLPPIVNAPLTAKPLPA